MLGENCARIGFLSSQRFNAPYWRSYITFQGNTVEINPFDNIDINNLEEYYDSVISVDGNAIEVDLNFESESIEIDLLKPLSTFFQNIESFSVSAFNAISKDFDLGDESETARFYLQHHIDELSESEILSIFGTTNIDKEIFFKHLSLARIGFYPEGEEDYAVFDIQLPEEYTNYLMAVTFDSEGNVSYISFDS